jgi:hypothetical protein
MLFANASMDDALFSFWTALHHLWRLSQLRRRPLSLYRLWVRHQVAWTKHFTKTTNRPSGVAMQRSKSILPLNNFHQVLGASQRYRHLLFAGSIRFRTACETTQREHPCLYHSAGR